MIVRKELTRVITLKGEVIKYADCIRLIEETKTVICNLLSEQEVILEDNAYFCYEGEGKNVPFTLTKADIENIKS